MSRLLITLMTGLLWAGTSLTYARELKASDPVRASLVDLARNTPASGLPADARLTLSRAWVDGSQAKVCALARRADGDLLIQDGRAQMKRVHLRKTGSKWDVERAERIVIGPKMTIDTACQQRSSEAVMADAIKLLETHPPTAGIKPPAPLASAICQAAPLRELGAQPSGPGVVAQPGRSLLHTAPDANCLMGKHIVEGDKVVILGHAPGWTQVRYTHPLTGVITVGWLQRDRVKPGTHGDAQRQAALTH
ncbi:MAG: hypothetical protein HY836_00570 [Aquabacterium sp.]|uniref:hypothetical protein n=1 Tax=Aquabacterium sp. TaxID=1872578 RepID=UPI0025C673A0|nr:hypothetical protein [Aquabacterium sp.]MBI5924073.1 hypothetical protein [Aquabacterium sp.]